MFTNVEKCVFVCYNIVYNYKENYTSRKAIKWLEEEIIEVVDEIKNEK